MKEASEPRFARRTDAGGAGMRRSCISATKVARIEGIRPGSSLLTVASHDGSQVSRPVRAGKRDAAKGLHLRITLGAKNPPHTTHLAEAEPHS